MTSPDRKDESSHEPQGDSGQGASFPSIAGSERAWLIRLLIATAVVLSPSLSNDFVLDDIEQIVRNRYLANGSFIWRSFAGDVLWYHDPLHAPQSPFYRPLHNIWLWLAYHLFGLNAMFWHAAMIAVYLLVVWLVFQVASILIADDSVALLAAGLFALMPVHVQAIAYPTAAATPFSAALELAAFWYYLRASNIRGGRLISLALFGLALLDYEGAVAFPALIAAHAFIFSGPTGDARDHGANKAIAAFIAALPYAIELAAYAALRYCVLGAVAGHGGGISPWQATLTIPAAIVSYLTLFVVPWRAGPAHNLTFPTSIASPHFLFPAIALILLCTAAFYFIARAARPRLYAFCAMWFVIALLPMLKLDSFFAPAALEDRYLFMPSFGLCVTAAGLAADFARSGARHRRAVSICAGAIGVIWVASLIRVQWYWRDEVALFSESIAQQPDVAASHAGLGMALIGRGDFAKARHELETAIHLEPNAGDKIYYDLALVDQRLGDSHAAAIQMANWLARAGHPTPGDYVTMALFADAAGDSAGAAAALAKAAAIPAGGTRAASIARAQILFQHGDTKGAEDALRAVLDHNPLDPDAHAALAQVLSAENRPSEALVELKLAVAVAPGDPNLHYQIATLLHQLGRENEAHDECAIVLSAAPYDPNARALMAAIQNSGKSP
ncbi:MAG TPA: tetratricopeptide repeat protein [Candidatus Binataceae bacterium]|nr:tetratricopeptide repeat protein [Candidatus Binataceae bacterium]